MDQVIDATGGVEMRKAIRAGRLGTRCLCWQCSPGLRQDYFGTPLTKEWAEAMEYQRKVRENCTKDAK